MISVILRVMEDLVEYKLPPYLEAELRRLGVIKPKAEPKIIKRMQFHAPKFDENGEPDF
jgi:hypothetical protein